MSYKLEQDKIDGKTLPQNSLRLSVGGDYANIYQGTNPQSLYAGYYYDFADNTGTPFVNITALITYWNLNFNGKEEVTLVDSTGATISPNASYLRSSVEITRPATTPTYAAGDSINETVAVIKELTNVTTSNGGGGVIMDCVVKCDDVTNMSGKSVMLYLYNTAPTPIADDSPLTELYADKAKDPIAIALTFNTPTTGSTSCTAEVSVIKEFVCVGGNSLFATLQHVTGGVMAASKHISITIRTVVS